MLERATDVLRRVSSKSTNVPGRFLFCPPHPRAHRTTGDKNGGDKNGGDKNGGDKNGTGLINRLIRPVPFSPSIYVLPDSELGKYLRTWHLKVKESPGLEVASLVLVLFDLVTATIREGVRGRFDMPGRHPIAPPRDSRGTSGLTAEEVMRYFESRGVKAVPDDFDAGEFGSLLSRENTRVFSPAAWRRTENMDE